MLYTVLVDRVGKTNVFNLIYENTINDPLLHGSSELYSIIDTDLISEYLEELGSIAKEFHSICRIRDHSKNHSGLKLHQININQKLKQVGQTVFRQFFPEQLQELIRSKKDVSFFFHVAPDLASIPFEIMHDGTAFLCEKLYIGKTIKGCQGSHYKNKPKENINMLIIADPTEDLDWARKEGEFLFEQLSTHFLERNLSLQLIGGRSVTKLSLLNTLLHTDIIHYCGHLHYNPKAPEESGWLLYGSKVIYAREIQKSGTEPRLIFSNSCLSGRGSGNPEHLKGWYPQFAGIFLRVGETNYIGTNWELPDTESTIQFTLKFYDLLLKGASLGAALQKTRKLTKSSGQRNDLTWASYLLIGNPLSKIFSQVQVIPDLTKNIIDSSQVLKEYPYLIAGPYKKFLKFIQNEESIYDLTKIKEAFQSLLDLTEQILHFILSIVLANAEYQGMKPLKFSGFQGLRESFSLLFELLDEFRDGKLQLIIPNLLETLFREKSKIMKVVQFKEQESSKDNKLLARFIAAQFLVENFLIEIEFFKYYGFYYIRGRNFEQLSLKGLAEEHKMESIVLPTQIESEIKNQIVESISQMDEKCILYIPYRKICLDLSKYILISFENKNKLRFKRFQFKKDVSIKKD